MPTDQPPGTVEFTQLAFNPCTKNKFATIEAAVGELIPESKITPMMKIYKGAILKNLRTK